MKKTEQAGPPPLRVGLISLGCAKNLVDGELMLGALLKDGAVITNDAREADAVIVNTCSFIDSAQKESVEAILESAEVRQATHPGQALIVAGCLTQRFHKDLPNLLPEVDAFMGIDQVTRVTEIVKEALVRRQARIVQSPKSKVSLQSTVHSPQSTVHSREAEVQSRKTGARTREGGIQPLSSPLSKTGNSTSDPTKDSTKVGNTQHATRNTLPSSIRQPVSVTARPTYIPDYATPRFRLTPRHFAYIKIAEGCNHPCSFCIIPRMRGAHRSRPQADLIAEARALLRDGVRELNLISQDSTCYGLDLRPNRAQSTSSPEKFSAAMRSLPAHSTTLCTLLRELNALPGDFWIRLLYTHPAHWTDELIRTIVECPKVARYVDIPLQHIHENMLERMRRETSKRYIVDLLGRIRAGIPGIVLRTTFIVGFPGETEEYFRSLLDFVEATKFERLGVFTYSREEGTRAGNMSGQVPVRTKQRRRKLAMAAQHKVAVQVAESFVGRTLRVLVEREASAKELQDARIQSWEHGLIRELDTHPLPLRGRYLMARSQADAPDIDGRVYVRGQVPSGEFARVKIVGHTDYDLIAEPV